jgi:hypothetical protein
MKYHEYHPPCDRRDFDLHVRISLAASPILLPLLNYDVKKRTILRLPTKGPHPNHYMSPLIHTLRPTQTSASHRIPAFLHITTTYSLNVCQFPFSKSPCAPTHNIHIIPITKALLTKVILLPQRLRIQLLNINKLSLQLAGLVHSYLPTIPFNARVRTTTVPVTAKHQLYARSRCHSNHRGRRMVAR